MANLRKAPDWEIQAWINPGAATDLAGHRGRVVALLAFQMLCPGCVEIALPQLRRVHETFAAHDVAAVGLHTVFENHAAMPPEALRTFLRDRRFDFPVAIDRPGPNAGLPVTMERYAMQGTPTLVLIDRAGRLRRQTFGHVPDLVLGAAIMSLLREPSEPQ